MVPARVSEISEEKVMKRHKIGRSHSQHMFTRHASKTHKWNMPRRVPMRGGIRM